MNPLLICVISTTCNNLAISVKYVSMTMTTVLTVSLKHQHVAVCRVRAINFSILILQIRHN